MRIAREKLEQIINSRSSNMKDSEDFLRRLESLPLVPLTTVTILLGSVIGFLYLLGYWHSFSINALEYASFGDLARYASFPIGLFFIFLTPSLIYSEAMVVDLSPRAHSWVRRIRDPLVAKPQQSAAAITSLIMATFLFNGRSFSSPLLIVLVGLYALPLSGLKLFKRIFPAENVRLSVLGLIMIFGSGSYSLGLAKAAALKSGYSELVVDHERSDIWFNADVSAPAIYLGRLGNFFFVYESKMKDVVVVPEAQVKTLRLKIIDSARK